jgi:nucleoside-diphosphate-sugar epimerase
MRIAITGSDGYIGTRLCSVLEKMNDVEVIRLSIVYRDKGYTYTDYSYDDLCGVLVGVDLVIHLAAVRTGQSIKDFYPTLDLTESLLNAMGHCGVKKMLFMSSIAVYSGEEKLPWKESQIVIPSTLYGIGKVACENLCFLYGRRYSITTLVLRLAPIYGPFDNNKRMIAYFVKNAREHAIIQVKGKSVAERDFVYIHDVIDVINSFVKDFPSKDEIYNVGPNERHTNLEIAQLVKEGYGTTSDIVYDDTVSENLCSAYMDVSKIMSKGFKPTSMLKAFGLIAKEESDV